MYYLRLQVCDLKGYLCSLVSPISIVVSVEEADERTSKC